MSNKDVAQLADSDPVERLLYSALVAATSRSNVGHLAAILNEDVDRLCQVRAVHVVSSRTSATVIWCRDCDWPIWRRPSPSRAGLDLPPDWRPYTVRDEPRSLMPQAEHQVCKNTAQACLIDQRCRSMSQVRTCRLALSLTVDRNICLPTRGTYELFRLIVAATCLCNCCEYVHRRSTILDTRLAAHWTN